MNIWGNKIQEFNKNHDIFHGDSLLVEKMRKLGMDDKNIAKALDALENTCRYCFDGERNCQCWNDE